MRRAAIVILVAVAASACLPSTSPEPSVGPSSGSGPTATSAQASLAPTPLATPAATTDSSLAELPGAGGTCSAEQLVIGDTQAAYDFGHLYDRGADFITAARNTGAACVIVLPKTIGVAPATGPFVAISVVPEEQQVCAQNTCHSVYPKTFKIGAGSSFTFHVGADWCDPACVARSPYSPRPCLDPVQDVTRAAFPLATGTVVIDLGVVVSPVCASSTPAMAVGVTLR